MTFSFWVIAFYTGLLFLAWIYIPKKEKVGKVLVPPSGKLKLSRLISIGVFLFSNYLQFLKMNFMTFVLILFLIGALTFIMYFETEEKIKSAKMALMGHDPRIIKDYESTKRTDFNVFAAVMALAVMLLVAAFLI